MIKKTLIVIIVLTIIAFSAQYMRIALEVGRIHISPSLLIVLSAATIIQLVGHLFRAMRTKLVTDQAASSSIKFQFGTLAIGYLFNTIFAVRVGELIRALLVARRLRISFLYTFTAIVIERTTDIFVLSAIVLLYAFFGGIIASQLLCGVMVVLLIAIIILAVIYLLKNENKILLKFIYSITHIFNNSINNSLRFRVWSLIFGLQNFFDNKVYVRKYVMYAFISWVAYLISTIIAISAIAPALSLHIKIFTTLSAYLASLPGLIDLSHQTILGLSKTLHYGISSDAFTFGFLLWFLLVVPISLVGVVALVAYRTKDKKGIVVSHPDAYTNKLLRYDDISQDFPAFLETYFQGAGLSKILHKIEVNGELSLVKFFKGGSDAITVLAIKDGDLFVKKIVPSEYADRLKVQYNWLKRFDKKRSIVQVLGEQENEDYYAIDLEYSPTNVSLFEYVHTHSLSQSKAIINAVWEYVFENIYKLDKEKIHTKERDLYVEDRLLNKVNKAIRENQHLAGVISEKRIKINGQEYDNFNEIITKIKTHPEAWKDLSRYRSSPITHGDLTVDNILVNTKNNKPYIIDPSDDNQVRGPIIDFARFTQSLFAGYEFLNADESEVYAGSEDQMVSINYHDGRSARYMELNDYFMKVLAKKYFTENERKTVLFHVGLLYGRMLAHRVVINPGNTLKYYAVSVILLNEFYNQYN